jgi:hypothetical protein
LLSTGLYLSGLWPPFAEAVRYLSAYASYYNYQGAVSSGFRSSAEQATLYAQGRSPYEVTHQIPKRLGIDVVTNAPAGHSAHNYGLAVDVEGRDQAAIVSLARELGFGTVSGDPAHLEWPNWKSLLG